MNTNTYRVRLLASILDLYELALIFESRFGNSKTLADGDPNDSDTFDRDGTPTPAFTFYLKSIADLEVPTDKRYRLIDLTEDEIQWLSDEIGYWVGWNADPDVGDDRLHALNLRGKRESFQKATRKAGYTGPFTDLGSCY